MSSSALTRLINPGLEAALKAVYRMQFICPRFGRINTGGKIRRSKHHVLCIFHLTASTVVTELLRPRRPSAGGRDLQCSRPTGGSATLGLPDKATVTILPGSRNENSTGLKTFRLQRCQAGHPAIQS
jgi:hypothetical protein